MPKVDITIEAKVSQSLRARQLYGIFDVPVEEKQRLTWQADLPIEEFEWNVGLIVGASGSGKTTIARDLFGADKLDWKPEWNGAAVVDDFDEKLSIEDIAHACRSVGFNTIPAWLRPYHVLSNGEKFRVELARRMLEQEGTIVVDEFTSVVDRQVGQVGSYAVAKYVRKLKRKFVAVTCHHDVIDWLQPDWMFSPGEGKFVRRSLQRRPSIDIEVGRLPYAAWRMFAPFHYMNATLHRSARCFGLWANGTLASFIATLHRPVSVKGHKQDIMGISRVVTLPDWQGLGLAFVLANRVAAAYKAIGKRLRNYPNHPVYVRSNYRSKDWRLVKPAAFNSSNRTRNRRAGKKGGGVGVFGGRQTAVFEYCGETIPISEARVLLAT